MPVKTRSACDAGTGFLRTLTPASPEESNPQSAGQLQKARRDAARSGTSGYCRGVAETADDGDLDEVGHRSGGQLRHDVGPVLLDGFFRQAEVHRDDLVGLAV